MEKSHTPEFAGPTARRYAARVGLLLAALLTAAAFSKGLPAHADAAAAPGLEKFIGSYKYAGKKEEGVAIVEKALDQALGDLNMVMKALAKRGMAQRFAETISIEGDARKLGIKIGDNDKVSVGIGKTEAVNSKDGKRSGTATHRFDAGKITESISGEDGTITNVFSLSADGKTLTRDAHVTSKRMQNPLKYRLLYTRK